MTEPTAKNVAKELDRIHRRRRLLILGGWVVLVVAAALYLRCGRGWGTGGKGPGKGEGTGSAAPAPHRCQVRVTAKGLELGGKPTTQDAIIDGCKQGVDLVVTGDSREGDSEALKSALDAAKIPAFERH